MIIDPLRLTGFGLILLGVLLVAGGIGLFLSPDCYEAVVRLKLRTDVPDEFRTNGFDEYWFQYELERLKSKSILCRVITNLDLTGKWAKKMDGPEPLGIEAAYARLTERIDVRQYRSTSLIEVKVKSADRIEAAAIANEIAEVYLRARMEDWRGVKQHGIRVLKAELERRSQAWTNKLSEIAALKASSATDGSEARDLDNLTYIRAKLSDRIRLEEEEERRGAKASLVEIVDRAEPPPVPRNHQKRSATAALLGGLGTIAVGRSLLRRGKDLAASVPSVGGEP